MEIKVTSCADCPFFWRSQFNNTEMGCTADDSVFINDWVPEPSCPLKQQYITVKLEEVKKYKREVVFDIPSIYGKYRVVCRIGYDSCISYAWWGHIQKQIEYKRFLFFGKKKTTWVEIDQCWWSKEFDSIADLKKSAEKFYDERVEMLPRVKNKALSLK